MSEADGDLDRELDPNAMQQSTVEPDRGEADYEPRRDMSEKAFRRYEPLIHRALSGSYLLTPSKEPGFGGMSPATFQQRFRDACLGWVKYHYRSVIPETDAMREKVRNLRAYPIAGTVKVRVFDKSLERRNRTSKAIMVYNSFDEVKLRSALDSLRARQCDIVTITMPDDSDERRVARAEAIYSLVVQWYGIARPSEGTVRHVPFKYEAIGDLHAVVYTWKPMHELVPEFLPGDEA